VRVQVMLLLLVLSCQLLGLTFYRGIETIEIKFIGIKATIFLLYKNIYVCLYVFLFLRTNTNAWLLVARAYTFSHIGTRDERYSIFVPVTHPKYLTLANHFTLFWLLAERVSKRRFH